MNADPPNSWDMASPSLRIDQVLALLRLGLAADEEGDVALDCEAWFEAEGASPLPNGFLDPQ